MKQSIVVYRIESDDPKEVGTNVSHALVQQLWKMKVVEPATEKCQVIREGNVTVTVYSFRKHR